MLPPLLLLFLRLAGGIIILPQKQYDSLHHDPVYSRISTATSFGGEYEPSPHSHQLPFRHPSFFPNPFLHHSPFGGCDCDEREREEEHEEQHLPRRRQEEEERWERDRDEIPKEEPRQYVAKIREIPSRGFNQRDEPRSEPAFTYLGPAED